MSYTQVKQNWVSGVWNKAMVKAAYQKGFITIEEYKEIIALPQRGKENTEENK